MKKIIAGIFLLLTLLGPSFALAQTSSDFIINSVEVNDIPITVGGNSVLVERGQRAVIEVFLQGAGNSDDVRVEARIGGYEFGTLRDETDVFEVESGVRYRKILTIDIPNDIDASDSYTLDIEVFDDDSRIENQYTLRVQEVRHDLNIQDIFFRPSTSIEAGRPLFTTVRVENLGQKKEEDIKIEVRIPQLGVATRDYIDELVTQLDEDDNNDEESSASSSELFLRIPDNAPTGDYLAEVTVEYNRGHSLLREVIPIHVVGIVQAPKAPEALVSISGSGDAVRAGESALYQVMIANLDDVRRVYSVAVDGTALFADATVEPQVVSVVPDSTGEVVVALAVKKDAQEGQKSFVIKVLSDDTLVKEESVRLTVERSALSKEVVGVIIGLIVILALVIGVVSWRRSQEGEEDSEPDLSEGHAYY